MPLPVTLALTVLVAAAGLLASEVWTGRPLGTRRGGRLAAAATFGVAAVAGATLLTALAGQEWPLALALVPLTALSVMRFGGLVFPAAPPWARIVAVGVILAAGVGAALQVVPVPLTRGHLSGAAPAHSVDRGTVRPYVSRPVRG